MLVKNNRRTKAVKTSLRTLMITAPALMLLFSFAIPSNTTPAGELSSAEHRDSLVAPLLAADPVTKFPHMDELSDQLKDLSPKALEMALSGYQYYLENGIIAATSLLAIADMSVSSDRERLYIIDPNKGLLLYHTFVAHGRNSGDRYATRFSNKPSSLQSSMGFFKTGTVYQGKHGNSLRLIGLEKGLNDKANEHGIVIHGADYVSKEIARSRGMIGRSWGCPAVPSAISNEIIETLRNDQCLFIYHPSYQPAN